MHPVVDLIALVVSRNQLKTNYCSTNVKTIDKTNKMITYLLHKSKIFKGFEPLLAYTIALDIIIIITILTLIYNLIK